MTYPAPVPPARRGLQWWHVALAVVAVLSCIAVAAYVGLIVLVNGMMDSDDETREPHALDAAGASAAMEQRDVGIPEGFAFGEMTVFPVFVGADTYRGRYDVLGEFRSAEHALAEANPSFPVFRAASCADEIIAEDFIATTGFTCDVASQIVVSTRSIDGKAVSDDNYQGTPPDCETLLLARNGDRTELFVLSRGH